MSHTWNEIRSQGEVWKSVLSELQQSAVVREILETSAPRTKWIFVGCGTSYYLAEAAATSWTMLTGLPARALPSSEVLLFPHLLRAERTGVQAVAISRSGKTSETLRATVILQRELQIPTFGITCEAGSELAAICAQTIALRACDEKSTVMTQSFTSMLLSLQFLAARRAGKEQFIEELSDMAGRFSPRIAGIAEKIETFVMKHDFEDFVFLGQGAFHGIAREAALKVMEMSCSYSQFFHTLEFRHGPKAIVSPATCLMFFLSDSGLPAETEVLAEMKELGGTTIAVCNRASAAIHASADLTLEMNGASELAWLSPCVVPGQLLGLFTGIKKGLNPDQPKNLTRVVVLD
ncbi:MAG: SIS domain-containing protein [Candidatus Acidiferrum sp.]|jgi:glucosamine--fructose-6-phosphate aminotransferase (isomerizing)